MSDETIEQFVTRTGKCLLVEISPQGYLINNYDGEGLPVEGWEWADPWLSGNGVTLAGAWSDFQRDMWAKPSP